MAKPDNWDALSNAEAVEMASELFKSFRGQFLIGQALYIASQWLQTQHVRIGEPSNATEMEMLGEALFGLGYIAAKESRTRQIKLIAECPDVVEVPLLTPVVTEEK